MLTMSCSAYARSGVRNTSQRLDQAAFPPYHCANRSPAIVPGWCTIGMDATVYITLSSAGTCSKIACTIRDAVDGQ